MPKLVIMLLRSLVLTISILVGVLWYAFGGGEDYPDLTRSPVYGSEDLQLVLESPVPVGNVAVSSSGRLFFTVHPEANTSGPRLYEAKEGEIRAYPTPDQSVFQSPLGVVVDRFDRLWVIDPANHGMGQPTLLAFDLESNTLVHQVAFNREPAPAGSFLQDLQIDSTGRYIFIADVGFWPKRPALLVHDLETGMTQRILERHPSVYPENWLIRTPIKDMSYFGGLINMKTGIDGIAITPDDQWLYYAAMNHQTLYRLPVEVLKQPNLDEHMVESHLEAVSDKPLNDGLSADVNNGIYITDIEHQAIMYFSEEAGLSTLIKDARIRWADSLSFGPDGWLYIADSAIPLLVLQSKEAIEQAAPFKIWRFKPATAGIPGQ